MSPGSPRREGVALHSIDGARPSLPRTRRNDPAANHAEHWWFGISPEGVGTLGMLLNFLVSAVVMRITPPPPEEVQNMVEHIRIPR